MTRLVRSVIAGVLVVGCLAWTGRACAEDDVSSLFAAGVKALHDGRAPDAIGALEALADRGLIDAAASYDRGLAYAMRVRIGAEVPGDLGRAAHGFEEARDLGRDPGLVEDAGRALTAVRSEVARRRVRAGEPVEVDPGRSLARTVAALLSENTWGVIAALASATMSLGLFVRWRARGRRVRAGGGVAAGIAAPVLALALVMTLAARHDRMFLREGVIVSPGARPSDEHGITIPGATTLPEGARVELVDARGSLARVRFGSAQAWVAGASVRELAR